MTSYGYLQTKTGIPEPPSPKGPALATAPTAAAQLPASTASANAQVQPASDPTQVAVYGFVAWIVSGIAWIFYLLWAFLPETLLRGAGVEYFPSKHWATALPAMLVVTFLFVGVADVALNLMRTAPLDSLELVHDEHSRGLSRQGGAWSMQQPYCTPEVADLPIDVVNRVLYQSSGSDLDRGMKAKRRFRAGSAGAGGRYAAGGSELPPQRGGQRERRQEGTGGALGGLEGLQAAGR